MSYQLKVNDKCNNNCIHCDDLSMKSRSYKNINQLKKEIDNIQDNHIILPCNSDIHPDFIKILNDLKQRNKYITLITNARMFYYQKFCNEIKNLVDEIIIMIYSFDSELQNQFTNTTSSNQSLEGIRKIFKYFQNINIKVPLIKENYNIINEVNNLINDIKKIEFKIMNPHPLIYKELNKIKSDKIKIIDIPTEVKFEITKNCNLSCSFCFNQNAYDENIKDLSKDEIFQIIDKISIAEIKKIRITGGEPFCRNDIIDILKYCKSKDLIVNVNSNVLLINKTEIKKLKNIVDRFLISIHSLEGDDYNYKLEIINELNKNNVNVEIDTIANTENIKKLEQIYNTVDKINGYWFMERAVPTKNNLYPLTNGDVKILIEKLLEIKNKYNKIIKVIGIPFCAYEPEKVKIFSTSIRECGIMNKIVIDPSGRFKPCYSINENLGNIFNHNINKVYNESLLSDIRKLKLLPEKCKDCIYSYECLGGCRFSAFLINGKYNAIDPLALPERYL